MKVRKQSAVIEPENNSMLIQLEKRGRICYQSEDKITEDSAPKFVNGIIKNGHNSVLEMAVICVDTVVNNPTKFMQVGKSMTSASVRAWREFFNTPYAPKHFCSLPTVFNDFLADIDDDESGFNIIPMPENDIDHTYVCVRFVTNRAVTHEIVRHRPCSFLQESQRYVRYDRPGGIEFIKPVWLNPDGELKVRRASERWESAMDNAAMDYCFLRSMGNTPQQARGVLPNDTKTEILVYCNLREWRHIFYQRTSPAADPQIIALMTPLLEEFRVKFPGHFDVLEPSVG